ncbi:hypothetical protein BRC75_05610 [Halobacteriales archaeon QH_7_69_31]|nr:MAG: hypothetical protein BRC75_05610 [Halobacteriales archaeon QH_7_69_31]
MASTQTLWNVFRWVPNVVARPGNSAPSTIGGVTIATVSSVNSERSGSRMTPTPSDNSTALTAWPLSFIVHPGPLLQTPQSLRLRPAAVR